jgi:hypothetical protein
MAESTEFGHTRMNSPPEICASPLKRAVRHGEPASAGFQLVQPSNSFDGMDGSRKPEQ